MQFIRVLHVSDIHLSEKRAYNMKNWEITLRHMDSVKPDFVVIGGDMIIDDPDDQDDQYFARQQMSRINFPWHAVPGNHDVGDSLPDPYKNQPVTEERLKRYKDLYGDDKWTFDIGAWRYIGLNSQLFASGLAQEAGQNEWLDSTLRSSAGKHIALFVHKPLCIDSPTENISSRFNIEPQSRSRLLEMLAPYDIRLIASGHTHRFRTLSAGGVPMVWAPTTAQMNTRMAEPRAGLPDQNAGVVFYRFQTDSVEWELQQPESIVPFDVTEFAAKYGAMRNAPEYRHDLAEVA
ncbi:hypothetical protein GOD21_30755 [Sinorhizobium medicae]|nr:hypothetical protein [Sinorhizobium medicae]